jgi:lysine-specific demethylase/histidyl-hydroxylase NO66
MSVDKFLSTKFSKQHHVFVRSDKSYHDEVFSTKDLDQYIKSGKVWFGKNLDVTSYEDGKRETHNPDGKASGPSKAAFK